MPLQRALPFCLVKMENKGKQGVDLFIFVCLYIKEYMYMYTYIHIYIYTYIHIHIREEGGGAHICIYILLYINTQTHIYIYIYTSESKAVEHPSLDFFFKKKKKKRRLSTRHWIHFWRHLSGGVSSAMKGIGTSRSFFKKKKRKKAVKRCCLRNEGYWNVEVFICVIGRRIHVSYEEEDTCAI